MDEMIEIIRGLTKGGFFEFHGKHYDLPAVKICPVPTQPIPILIGGHAEPALRRAARIGDGWMHAGGDAEALHGYSAAARRAAPRVRARARAVRGARDRARRLHARRRAAGSQDLGVTDAIVGFRNAYEKDTQTLAQKTDALRRFADAVIAKA